MLSRERLEKIVEDRWSVSECEAQEMARELLATWRPITEPPNAGERVFVWSGGLPHVGLYSPDSQAYFFDCDTYGIRKEEAEAWMPINPPARTDKGEA